MYANGVASRSRKERKVSLVFRHPNEGKHCAGVEALLFPSVPNHKLLFTASRDSTVKRWDVAGPEPVLEASFEGHADWVNDLALIGDLLITCSNDQTVRLWKAGSDNGQHLHTLSYHSDYVTCLAAAPARSLVVSAGLRAEIFLLNIETGKHSQLYPKSSLPTTPHAPGGGVGAGSSVLGGGTGAGGVGEDGLYSPSGGVGGGPAGLSKNPPGSVYALALNPTGTVLAAGTSEALIRLLDPRSGKKITKLRGHQDTVRALMVNSDGTTLLSGASDGTIKLWDVGMQRCVQTYTVHSDSVWSLMSPDDSFSVVYSAGRDRCIYRTYTHNRTTELLVVEDAPVHSMALDPDAVQEARGGGPPTSGVGLWVATPASHVNLWVLPRELPGSAGGADGGRSFSVARRSLGVTANMRHRSSLESNRQPLARIPETVIPGTPGIVAHEVLADRRHVLTQDMRGNVALWDVLQGGQVASYGKVDFAAKRRELWEARSVPSWFSSDTRLGCLSITLEPPSAFMAEEYAVQLEYANVSDDCKVNFGKLVLDCAFAKWRHKLAQHSAASPAAAAAAAAQPPLPGSTATSPQPLHPHPHSQAPGGTSPGLGPQSPSGAAAGNLGQWPGGQGASPGGGGGGPDGSPGGQLYYHDLWPKYWQCRAVPAVTCSRQDGQRWRRLISAFDGSETEPGEVPTWVGDVVLRNASVTPKEAKCAFILLPAEGSNLPPLTQSKLNAPRILQVHKVAHYCCSKLQDQHVVLEVRPFYHRRPANAPPDPPPDPASNHPVLELVCNGMAVPFEMSLASVKKFLWKKPDDLVFHYRVRDPAHPAPAPVLGPPG